MAEETRHGDAVQAREGGGGHASSERAGRPPAPLGWRVQYDGEWERPSGVIGVIVAQKFPEPELIREKLEEGLARVAPGTVWVLREAAKSNHAVTVAWDTLRDHGVEPFLAPLLPYFTRRDGREAVYDHRRAWRDAELRLTCERIIVFHDSSSNVTAGWSESRGPAKIFVIERGKKKKRAPARGRKPVGA